MRTTLKLISAVLLLTACQPTTSPTDQVKQVTSESPSSISVPTLISTQSFAETEAQLRESLETRNLKLFTVVDHGAGAKSIGEDIGGSKLFIFGNPKAGTPLMQSEPNLGLALPMKILLRDVNGKVTLHRTDIATTVRAYGVTDQAGRLAKISETLDTIMAEAAGN